MLPAHRLMLSQGFRQNPPGIQLKGILPLEHLGVDYETSLTLPLPAGHGVCILEMGKSFSYLD